MHKYPYIDTEQMVFEQYGKYNNNYVLFYVILVTQFKYMGNIINWFV